MTPGVVFDCMVLLQAAGRPNGPGAACVARAEAGFCTLFVSDAGVAELRDVLDRPRTRKRFPLLTDESVAEFFARLDTFAVRIGPAPEVITLARDPKDAKYLNLAVAAGAELVVSRDNDLLDLMTGTDAEAIAFRTTYPAIRILDPVAFLQSLAPPPPPAP